jgi:hypothetical protein
MTDPYRDVEESLLAKNRALEEKLAEREREIEELKRSAAHQDAVFHRLEGVLDAKTTTAPKRRIVAVGAAVFTTIAIVGGVVMMAGRARALPPPPVAPVAAVPLPAAPAEVAPVIPTGDLCATPGVKLNVDGSDAFAPASNERDLAGHKYRRGGSRSPWFTVNLTGNTGPLYVHGVGDYLSGDLGTTKLSLLTIMTKGDSGGYTLARGGRSMVEITRSDGKMIAGRFEADVSRVAETTREPPFGTPVVRARGTFCLPAYPANPQDTGP